MNYVYSPHFASPSPRDGGSLARLPREQRVAIAVALLEGRAHIVNPTKKLAALMCGVSRYAVDKARGIRKPRKHPTLAQLLRQATQADIIEAFNEIGVDAVWSEKQPSFSLLRTVAS